MSHLPDSIDRVIEMSTVGRSLVPTDPGGVYFVILLTSEMLVNLRMVVINTTRSYILMILVYLLSSTVGVH